MDWLDGRAVRLSAVWQEGQTTLVIMAGPANLKRAESKDNNPILTGREATRGIFHPSDFWHGSKQGNNLGISLTPARLVPMALSFLFFPEEPEGGGIWISTL